MSLSPIDNSLEARRARVNCQHCQRFFVTPSKLKDHVYTWHGWLPLEAWCFSCAKRFSTFFEYFEHIVASPHNIQPDEPLPPDSVFFYDIMSVDGSGFSLFIDRTELVSITLNNVAIPYFTLGEMNSLARRTNKPAACVNCFQTFNTFTALRYHVYWIHMNIVACIFCTPCNLEF